MSSKHICRFLLGCKSQPCKDGCAIALMLLTGRHGSLVWILVPPNSYYKENKFRNSFQREDPVTDPSFLQRCSLFAGSFLGAAALFPSLGLYLQLSPMLTTEPIHVTLAGTIRACWWVLRERKGSDMSCKGSWSRLVWWITEGTLCQLVEQHILASGDSAQ